MINVIEHLTRRLINEKEYGYRLMKYLFTGMSLCLFIYCLVMLFNPSQPEYVEQLQIIPISSTHSRSDVIDIETLNTQSFPSLENNFISNNSIALNSDDNEVTNTLESLIVDAIKQSPETPINNGAGFVSRSESDRSNLYVDPTFYKTIKLISPSVEKTLSHLAFMHGYSLSIEEAKNLLVADEYISRMALISICKNCVKALYFYEKSVSGRLLNQDEVKSLFANQNNIRTLTEAANHDDYIVNLFEM